MKHIRWFILVVTMALISRHTDSQFIGNSFRNLIYNAVGNPLVHKKQHWPFDPEAGLRRAAEYQAVNGRLGELAIERIGLGIDGHEMERLQYQRIRDQELLREDNAHLQ